MAWRNLWLPAAILTVLFQALVSTVSAAEVRVSGVELFEEGESTGVLLTGNGALTYRLLSQEEPPRVLVQLPGAEVRPSALPEVTSKGLVRNVKLHTREGQPPRLELLLARAAEAQATREGSALTVTLSPKEGAAADDAQAESGDAQGPPQLRDYAVSATQDGARLLFKTSHKVRRFQSFQLDGPPRLVLDLYGAASALPRKAYDLDHPLLKRVRFGERDDRTRVVLELKERVTHSVEPTGQGLRLALRRTSAREGFRHVRDVNFTVGPKPDVGQLEVKLDRTGAEARVQREEGRVVLDLPKTRLPERLQKRLVVTDFGTAVKTVDLYQKGDRVRAVLSGSGPLDPTTYQLDGKLVLNVGKKEAEKAKRGLSATGKPYEGEKLSLNFQNIDVRQALNILADFADLNIVASDSVAGQLTLRLQEVPWDQALDLILDSQGLGMVREGNVIRVAPQAELQKQREQKMQAELKKQQLVPLKTEIIQVNYAKAGEIKSLLENQAGGEGKGGGMLSQRGNISVDARTNSLLVRETPEQIRAIRKLVEKLDRPTRQVMIEARIVKIDTSYERNLGVRWGGSYTNNSGTNTVSGTLAGAQAGTPALALDLPAAGASGGGPASLGMRLGSISNNATLDLELQAIEAEGNGKVISSPRVVTANQQEATIEQGTEIPYQQATSSGATSVSFKKAVLSLAVTPQITPDGRLIMDVNASNDTVGQSTVAGPAIDTEEVETQVLVDDGETVVIGGIYAKSEREDRTGVPLLRKIPLLGWLFRTKSVTSQKNELLIFLTPRIVDEQPLAMQGKTE
ncbi:type IV pilus secretin PilQ [Thiohalorhabdus methylotrophus]|uniref:Type IV pilus secretin PilQ n=1 Tax=Thiohalorhabdus methylotrophus TaxID=3242694 RepID=A0ABV4TPQ0_9GAMM